MVTSWLILLGLLPLMAISSSDSFSNGVQTYIVHVDASKVEAIKSSLIGTRRRRWPEAILDSLVHPPFTDGRRRQEAAAPPSSDTPQLIYVFDVALSGFAAKLSADQVRALRRMDGVLMAYPDTLLELHTTYSPQFLGLELGKGLWSSANSASDVIVGVVDTGIWPEHRSFSDAHVAAEAVDVHKRWRGTCEEGTRFSTKNCNKKLIGARAFWKGYEALGRKVNDTDEYRSPRDSDGHGTHTASTAAGNTVSGASLFGNAKGLAKGMSFNARIAAYKACWKEGCANSDILAAIDQAVADGVDVLSLSIGGGSRPYYIDSIAIAAFGAVQRGVFVSCSAGNSGPYESTVSNTAPWIMTVAASYIGRSFPAPVKLGDGRVFRGASLYTGPPTGLLQIVYDNSSRSARACAPGFISKGLVRGKIVLCDRGLVSRTKKGEQVKLAGGEAMLLLNSDEQGEEFFADAHVLPASSLGAMAAAAIRTYVASSSSSSPRQAMITFLGTVYGEPAAPAMAAFSSRGPSLVDQEIIKPDVTAPGVNILAAWPPTLSPSLLESDQRRVEFNIISGTSMSCPHVSGLAALLKSVHPDWSPAAIKSALMTTAYISDKQNGSILDVSTGLPATPFAYGSGHVDPEKASNPGLIYDISAVDYLNYLCSLNYTQFQLSTLARTNYSCPKGEDFLKLGGAGYSLNYPSFAVTIDSGKHKSGRVVTQTRMVTNVGSQGGCSKYTIGVLEPEGVKIKVSPKKLVFTEIGQKLAYRVSFAGSAGGSGYSFGELVWSCGSFSVRSPIAVIWQ